MNMSYDFTSPNEAEVTCPACYESFTIVLPSAEERPTVLDYDCEICCRPMNIHISASGDAVALSHDDLG